VKKFNGFIVLFVIFILTSNLFAATLYSVREGDTLALIASKYSITIDSILAANKDISSGKPLTKGKVLIIPESGETVNAQMVKDPTVIKLESKQNNSVYQNVQKNGDNVTITIHGSKNGMEINKRKSLGSRGAMVQGLIRTSMKYIGVPYVWGGTSPNGFDCSGFTMRMFQYMGINIPRTADIQYSQGSKIRRSDLLPGDLIFFETYTSGASHVGIYIGNNSFIHASSSGGVTISSLLTSYYSSRYYGACRY